MQFRPALGAVLALLSAVGSGVAPAAETLTIQRFEISGNRILDEDRLQAAVMPYTGDDRVIDDIRAALAAIENAYRAAGHGAVRAVTPEQEITSGVIRIRVIEAELGRVEVLGNRHFSERNVLGSLPSLRSGEPPDLRRLAQELQLANENPARKSEVLLSATEQEGVLDARVLVEDSRPLRVLAVLDNTGNSSTGRHRIGLAVQQANLFDRDHVATAAYTTSPEELDKVEIYSLSYRLPLYRLGDSIDLIYGDSSVDAATSETVAGPLDFRGDGRVILARYNHYLPRSGEFSSRLTFGWEQRKYDNECVVSGLSCGSADTDIEVRPASVTYSGQWDSPGRSTDFYLTAVRNFPGGADGNSSSFEAVRAGADKNYAVFRSGATHLRPLGAWRFRSALHAQYASDPLIPAEQFGLAGTGATRGFEERELASDSGVTLNVEFHSPSFPPFESVPGGVAWFVLFADAAAGRNRNAAFSPSGRDAALASAGAGLRGELGTRASLQLDVACVVDTDGAVSTGRGDIKAHFVINVLF